LQLAQFAEIRLKNNGAIAALEPVLFLPIGNLLAYSHNAVINGASTKINNAVL
jgi:hypothetical protein